VNSDQFRRYLKKQGCTFEPGKGGHLIVRRGELKSALPQHGGKKQLGTGLMKAIKKDLGIDQDPTR
jgi:mRNA interferase HicA